MPAFKFHAVAAAGSILAVAAQPGALSPCTTEGNFNGTSTYVGKGPSAAPLLGNVGCVDAAALARRPLSDNGTDVENGQDAYNVYGPMEAGFTSSVPGMSCLGSNTISGGIDTQVAELMVAHLCDGTVQVLDYCGGHAIPYHYHEKLSCLYEDDTATGHSTLVATALDGNGIYGHHINGGVEPTDLDACGGRYGATPDSNGQEVYYYVIQSSAPFTTGCFGPVSSVEECRSLYSSDCDGVTETITTNYGTGKYDLFCPCFDDDGSNVLGQGRPGYLSPLEAEAAVAATTPADSLRGASLNVPWTK